MSKSEIFSAIEELRTSIDVHFQATNKLFQKFTTTMDSQSAKLHLQHSPDSPFSTNHFPLPKSEFLFPPDPQLSPPSLPTPNFTFVSSSPHPTSHPPILSSHSHLFSWPPTPPTTAQTPAPTPLPLPFPQPTPLAFRRAPPSPQPPLQPPPPMLCPSPPPVLPLSLSPPKPPPPTDPPLNFIDISPLFRSLPIPPLIPKSPLAISVEILCADLHMTHRSSEFSYTASSSRSPDHTQINPPQNSVPQAQIPTCSLPQSSPAVLPTPHSTQRPPRKWSNIHRCRNQFLLLLSNDKEEDSCDPELPDLALEDKVALGDISSLHTLTPVSAKEEMKFGFNSSRVQLCGEPPPETPLNCFNQLQAMANLEKRKHFLGIYIWPTSAEPNLYLVLRPNLSGPNSATSATPSPSALHLFSRSLCQFQKVENAKPGTTIDWISPTKSHPISVHVSDIPNTAVRTTGVQYEFLLQASSLNNLAPDPFLTYQILLSHSPLPNNSHLPAFPSLSRDGPNVQLCGEPPPETSIPWHNCSCVLLLFNFVQVFG